MFFSNQSIIGKPSLNCLCFVFSLCFLPVTGFCESKKALHPKAKKISIRQDAYRKNGLWVCKPDSLEKKIMDIIYLNNIHTSQDYAQWLKKNIRYRRDPAKADSWAQADETLIKKTGDCEDYAFLNKVFLGVLGYEARVIIMGAGSAEHAVCIFKEGQDYWWFDNSRLKKTQNKSLLEFARYIFEHYECYYLLTLDYETKSKNILFKKSEVIDLASRY